LVLKGFVVVVVDGPDSAYYFSETYINFVVCRLYLDDPRNWEGNLKKNEDASSRKTGNSGSAGDRKRLIRSTYFENE